MSDERLPKWLLVSLVLHGGLILGLLLSPFWPSSSPEPPPSYVVDLVGGERIGGRNFGTRLVPETKAKQAKPAPPEPPPKPKPAKVEAPPPEPVKKAEKKPEKASKVVKLEKVKAKASEEVLLAKAKVEAKREEKKREPVKPEPVPDTKSSAASDENSLDKVRERLIQSAIERARNRANAAQGSPDPVSSKDKGELLSAGSGEGLGAQSLGKGGVGGEGVLKSIEYIRYFNNMEATLKANWAWAGPRRDLKALVRFGIRESGEIVGVKIVESSGDSQYDESVIRAVRKSSPLAVPPEKFRKEFSDVQFYFQPDKTG